MWQMQETFGGASIEAISAFEELYSLNFEASYRRFLMACNGGMPKDNEFAVPGWGSTAVHYFYGLGTNDCYSLEAAIDPLEKESLELLPIATDGGGYQAFLAVRGEFLGAIYFWEPALARPVFLSATFREFFCSLRPDGAFDDAL